ncbi:hypothetical protein J5X84_03575 [Streptosporangiaceae bacterium NEAU-GS5]|nr:hypothetical protein [Streptosporangiaceae bacterium NEAU-GS5]
MAPRVRIVAAGLCAGLSLAFVSACGSEPALPSAGTQDAPAGQQPDLTLVTARNAFARLKDLDDAWKKRDCTKIEFMTTDAESTLGGRVCQAARNGRAAPSMPLYDDVTYYLPRDGDWFAALAQKPSPAYFVFAYAGDDWRLAAGPIPVVGKAPKIDDGVVPSGDSDTEIKATLVPQQYLTYLTDPAGVSGVRFASGDPMRDLLSELIRNPLRVRPDRVGSDVSLIAGPSRALLLPGNAALVFHALKLVITQKAGPGRSKLAHPLRSAADIKAFTGKTHPDKIVSTELLLVATRISSDNAMTTIGFNRIVSDITS